MLSMGKSTISMVIFNSYVKSAINPMKCPFSYGCPMIFLWFLLIYQRVTNKVVIQKHIFCGADGQALEAPQIQNCKLSQLTLKIFNTRWCPQDSVQLVNITLITMVYGTQRTIVFMGFINQLTSLGGTTLQVIKFPKLVELLLRQNYTWL